MASNLTQFGGGYNSFSGIDIKAVFGNEVIGELQAISYAINREKAPVYTMGSPDARSFSRGKRGIAGTCIFIMFDRHAVLRYMGMMRDDNGAGATKFFSDIDDLRPEMQAANQGNISTAANVGAIVAGSGSSRQVGSGIEDQESALSSVASDQQAVAPWYADQILPFDITLAAANEYGHLAVMRIYGVEFLNEAYGVSVDDIQSAQQMTFIARQVVGWRAIKNPNINQLYP